MKTILLPGGLGYIGSHTIAEILQKYKIKIIVIDDFSNCRKDIIERLHKTVGQDNKGYIHIRKGNILNKEFLSEVFQQQKLNDTPIQGIIHFAAKKNANQSVQKPFLYYQNNVVGSLNLLQTMQKFPQCKSFIFSSTAAVYGDQDNCTEQFECKPISPYGQTKLCVQMLLKDAANVHPQWRIISLRYFNPAGSHQSGLLGDWPSQYPGNLFPVIQQFIIGKRTKLQVYGNDYPTPDGSGVRDYIHITDLAHGHINALQYLNDKMNDSYNYDVFNLGCATGYSVLQVIHSFQKSLGKQIKYEIALRRNGDMSKLVANVDKAHQKLNWRANKNLQDMCDSCCNFIRKTLVQHKFD